MKALILVYCLSGVLWAQGLFVWQSDSCPSLNSTKPISTLVLPANLMCADNEPNCYEPSSRWDVGLAILNGPFKSAKTYFKYCGKSELAALAGVSNAMSDSILLSLREGISFQESLIFLTRISREALRAMNGATLQRIGSYADFNLIPNNLDSSSNIGKALLKIPLLIEKNLDWGDESTPTTLWLISSMPGLTLSLLEHYGRYHRLYTFRPLVGFGLVVMEAVSFHSLCTKQIESLQDSAEENYKNARQFFRILLHGIQYFHLFTERNREGAYRFQKFTYLSMLEHLLVSAMDLVYYNWYLQPKGV